MPSMLDTVKSTLVVVKQDKRGQTENPSLTLGVLFSVWDAFRDNLT